MGKIWMLTIANIRKAKGQAVSLLLFVMIASTFLSIGLMLHIDYGKSFDNRFEELNAPHTVILQSENITEKEQEKYLEQYPQVTQVEKQEIIATYGDYFMNGARTAGVIVFANAEKPQEMNPLRLVGESQPLTDSAIYVPYLMKTAGGYQLGDKYQLNLAEEELQFTIAGFTEEMSFGALMNTLYRFYVNEQYYAKLRVQFPDYHCILQSVRLEESNLGTQLHLDYEKNFFYSQVSVEQDSVFAYFLNFDSIKMARIFIPTIIAMLIAAFALILLAVSLIIIRFRIINNIEEGITGIGALKAIGYQSSQIISSIVLQFAGTALLGSLLGIVISRLIAPLFGTLLETQSAFIWRSGFNVLLSAMVVCILLGTVLLVAFSVAVRIRKLSPLVALRSGLATHSFHKNRVQLEKTYSPLTLALALKQFLHNKKQSVMITFIIVVVSFASVLGLTTYYNIGVKTDDFIAVVVGEKADVGFMLKIPDNEYVKSLNSRSDVRKAFGYQDALVLMDGYSVSAFIAKDFSLLEGELIQKGRYPVHDNEVAVNGLVAETVGLQIGDWVTVQKGSNKKEYLITGLIQLMQNNGINILMTYDGLRCIQMDFQFSQIYVYLHEGENSGDFIRRLKVDEGDIFSMALDSQEQIDAQFNSFGSIFAALAFGILTVTVLVVFLVLYMVIKTLILRKKRDIGIQKALGFTTPQLMNQIALGFAPIAFIGVLLGGLAGHFGFNPIFTAILRSAGIMKTELSTPVGWTIVTCIALVMLTYLISILIAWRIRKITPYTLVSE